MSTDILYDYVGYQDLHSVGWAVKNNTVQLIDESWQTARQLFFACIITV